jgi:hypothetical protein
LRGGLFSLAFLEGEMITATDWRTVTKSSLRGFAVLELSPSGLVLRDCALHERDGKRWISLPSRPQLDAAGQHRKGPATGKALWLPVVEIKGKAERERFQAAALAAIDQLRGRP